METRNKKDISRREFLRRLGVGTAVSAAALAGCVRDKTTSSHVGQGEVPAGGMTYRTTPSTEDKVSLLGYGCMRWGMAATHDDSAEGGIDQAAVNRLIDYAIEHGVNYFDTAPVYGNGYSERATGRALSRHPRDKYFIATKISNLDPSTWSREASIAMYRNSFKELQVDYIDYLLLHAVGMGNGMKEFESRFIDNGMLDFLLKERGAGRVRNLGFSFHGDIAVFDHLLSQHDKYHWDFVQIQLNYVDWKHAKEEHPRNTNAEYLYGELEKRGIPAVIMEPLLGGRLSNVHDHIAANLKERNPDASVASWAFRFAGSFPGVLTVLSGMEYMEHLQENLRTFSPLRPLTADESEFLEGTAQLLLRYPTIPCNGCNYCMPCPYGLDIPGILQHFNKCINEGNMPATSQSPSYRQARRAFLVGYDRSVPRLRQADHCIGCKLCMRHCPQNINIPRQMQRIDDFVEKLKQGKEF